MNTGEIKYLATIDTSNYKKGEKEIEKSNSNIESSTKNVEKKGTNSFANLGKGVAKGIGIATVAITAFAAVASVAFLKSSIDSASQLQSIRASFESLTGSAEVARKVIGDLNSFSLETAFSNDTINSASRTLLGFGVSADNLLTVMRQLGDIAGATGGDPSSLALVTGQVFAQGRLQAQDYYQIINSGAGTLAAELRKVVKEKTGLKDIKEAFEDGLVTADMYAEALRRSNLQGGFAFEGAIKQSKTFEGRLSNLQEGLTNIGLAIIGVDRTTGDVKVGGIFDTLSQAVSNATEFIDKNKESIILFINTAIKPLGEGFMILVQAVQLTIQWLQPLLDYVANNQKVMEVLKTTVLVLAGLFLGLVVASVAAVIIVVTALTAAIELLIYVFTWLFESSIKVFNWLKTNWPQVAGILIEPIAGAVGFIIGQFLRIRDIAGQVSGWFSAIGINLGNALGGAFNSVINAVLRFAVNKINGFIDSINTVVGIINKIPGVDVGQIGRLAVPQLATGGIISSPTLAMIGEGREPEAVIPLSKLDEILNNGATNNNTSNSKLEINVSGVIVSSPQDQRKLAEVIGKRLNEIMIQKGFNPSIEGV